MVDPKLVQQEIREAPSEEARLELLLDRSMTAYRTHPNDARKWADDARKLAKKLKRPLDEARAIYRMGCAALQKAEYDDARTQLNESAARFRELEDGAKYADAPLFMLAQIEYLAGHLPEARAAYEEVLKLRTQFGKNNVWEVLVALGLTELRSGHYAESLKYFYDALSHVESDAHKLARSIVYTNIGSLYLEIHDTAKAREFMEKALVLQREIGDPVGIASVLGNLASLSLERSELPDAERFATEALAFADDPSCRSTAPYVSAILGSIAKKQNNVARAEEWYRDAGARAKELGLESLQMEIAVNEAEIAIGQRRKMKQTIATLERAIGYFEREGHDASRCHALSLLAKAYEQNGDLESAVRTFNAYIELTGLLFSQDRQRAVVEVQARVEIEKLERERKRMEDVAKSASERAELLQQEAARQTSELTALALQLVKKNEFLTDLREKIEQQPSGRAAQDLITEIDDHVRSDRDWEVFENQLNQVHADFLKKLSSRYPSLTPMELKTAALMKLNLTSKAIASLFCISVRTVENHRLNIRRKLALDPDDNLVSFLSGL